MMRSERESSKASLGDFLPMVCTLMKMWYSRGCGNLYPAKMTSLSRCSCLHGVLMLSAPHPILSINLH